MLTATQALSRIQAESIRNGERQAVGTVSPSDVIRQGDLYLVALGKMNRQQLTPTEERQLAPGTTQGSRHVLAGKVAVYRAKKPADIATKINGLVRGASVPAELLGPIFRTGAGCELTHPEHGNFALPEGEWFAVVYQRAFAEEIRRQQD